MRKYALNYTQAMADLRAEFGGCCIDCGTTRTLEFSHEEPTAVAGRGRGMPQRYHDIKRNPEKYRLRCRRCHGIHDGKAWGRVYPCSQSAAPTS